MKISTICYPMRDDKIFLAIKKRGFGIGHLNGYGGKPQPGDITIEHTAVRELKEEGGIIASPKSLEKVGIIKFFEEDIGVFECHVFFCRKWKGQLRETEEMGIPQAHPILNLPYEQMWDADKVWLPIICSGEKINAISIYNKGMTKQVGFEYKPL
jgi:8-oxo-dGTP pyrophosphatase MutT (NUDIX family)